MKLFQIQNDIGGWWENSYVNIIVRDPTLAKYKINLK